MEIKLAKTAGFCMGVRRAVDKVLDVAQHEMGRRIYTYGPLIHNPQTIELLKNRGITAIKSIDEISDHENAVLVIRAHGIAPDERKKIRESGITIIDATCPKVGYVQAIIKKHTALDYTVIIAGDREHPEVDGLWGYTEGRGLVVSTLEDAGNLPAMEKVCIVAQTTQDTDHYHHIVEKIKEKIPQAIVFNTICSSTERRQEEIITLATDMDALFVVGGKNSANTCRLADLARKQNTPTFHIETAEEGIIVVHRREIIVLRSSAGSLLRGPILRVISLIRGNLFHVIHQHLGVDLFSVGLALDQQRALSADNFGLLRPGAREDDQLNDAMQVFQGREGHFRAFFSDNGTVARNLTGYDHFAAVLGFLQLCAEMRDTFADIGHIRGKRVIGQVDAQQFMFPFKLFAAIQGGYHGQVNFLVQAFHKAENGHLSGFARLEMALADRHDVIQAAQQGVPVGKSIQRTHADQGFQRAPADLAQVHAAGKVIDVLELTAIHAGCRDQIDRVLADVLDRAQAKADQ